jgi:hypothetical protein
MIGVSFPYEIWHYYKLDKMSNAKFIFYDTDLVNQAFDLLHSNVPGEPSEPSWQYIINGAWDNNLDNMMDRNTQDSRATDFWSNPR